MALTFTPSKRDRHWQTDGAGSRAPGQNRRRSGHRGIRKPGGQNLVRNSDAKVPFTIKVIDSEEINAFALPGGFFFVNTGILLNADNEAEMAV